MFVKNGDNNTLKMINPIPSSSAIENWENISITHQLTIDISYDEHETALICCTFFLLGSIFFYFNPPLFFTQLHSKPLSPKNLVRYELFLALIQMHLKLYGIHGFSSE